VYHSIEEAPTCGEYNDEKCPPAALENTALNVVCNQEYAQAVPHVSFLFHERDRALAYSDHI